MRRLVRFDLTIFVVTLLTAIPARGQQSFAECVGEEEENPNVTEFEATGSKDTYEVPPGVTEIFAIVTAGTGGSRLGGLVGGGPATLEVTIPVTPGEVLEVLAGNFGSLAAPLSNTATGGGGASYIARTAPFVPLVVAGGGGGLGFANSNGGDANASVTVTASAGGGTGGGGAGAGTDGGGAGDSTGGGGGGGLTGAGGNAAGLGGGQGAALSASADGGLGDGVGTDGGFGGGGGGGACGGGGGGGYAGGGGGGSGTCSAGAGIGGNGGGGSSFVGNGAAQLSAEIGDGINQGSVQVCFANAAPAVSVLEAPTLSTWGVGALIAALAVAAALILRRRAAILAVLLLAAVPARGQESFAECVGEEEEEENPNVTEFLATGSKDTYTVPADVTELFVQVVGGSGGERRLMTGPRVFQIYPAGDGTSSG